jgi:hypothetical protein
MANRDLPSERFSKAPRRNAGIGLQKSYVALVLPAIGGRRALHVTPKQKVDSIAANPRQKRLLAFSCRVVARDLSRYRASPRRRDA